MEVLEGPQGSTGSRVSQAPLRTCPQNVCTHNASHNFEFPVDTTAQSPKGNTAYIVKTLDFIKKLRPREGTQLTPGHTANWRLK